MSDEHLYRELMESEQREDALYRQNLAPKAVRNFTPKEIDHAKAALLAKTEIAPVFARRKRAQTSVAYRLFLKATGQWKGMDAKDVELVNPTRGFVMTGPTDDEIRALIATDPKAVRQGAALIPAVQPVNAERKTRIEPMLGMEARDES